MAFRSRFVAPFEQERAPGIIGTQVQQQQMGQIKFIPAPSLVRREFKEATG